MFCIPIVGPTFPQVEEQIRQAERKKAMLELRFDLFDLYSFEEIKRLRSRIKQPVIFTWRAGNPAHLAKLATLKPTYFDLEHTTSLTIAKEIAKYCPLIISYHNFTQTPSDLDAIVAGLKQIPATLYKISCQAQSTNDSLRMLLCIKRHKSLLGTCMGELGSPTRILGLIFGAPWIYTCLTTKEQSAPGQIPIDDFLSIYAPTNLSASTSIYGLIGDPVTTSISHLTHNRVMQEMGLNAIYVKMQLQPHELQEFFPLAEQIGIKGLSVTMPLKEQVLPYLTTLSPDAKKIGAVNTIAFQQHKRVGYNTDGKGALDAIEERFSVKNKKIAIIGAGGAARALIYEALQRGACVTVLNRTPEKAAQLAQEFSIATHPLDALQTLPHDILINTTPNPNPCVPLPNTLVMDIKTFPPVTPFLHTASQNNCELVFGHEMFTTQAALQFKIWFSEKLKKQQDPMRIQEMFL